MRKLYILQGLPGSGKSSYAESMERLWTKEGKKIVICSADSYYEEPCLACRYRKDPGPCATCKGKRKVFRFVPGKGAEAHGQCFRNAVEACRNADIVVIDNTNTTVAEVAPYMALANAYGYEVKFLRFSIPILESFHQNVHGVPMDTILWMNNNLDRFDDEAPDFWPKAEIL